MRADLTLRIVSGIVVLLLTIMLLGCDEFSLHDRFYRFDLPPTPEDFTADAETDSPQSIELRWSYDTPDVDGFRIVRREEGEDTYSEIATENTLGLTTREHLDENLSPNTTYTYRMYAVAGDYLSAPTPERSTQSNE